MGYLDGEVQCEWCIDKASYKILDGDYRRYACGDVYHRENLKRLARMDGHKDFDIILGYFTIGDP
jgi:hypothetical protein